ncbi:uncharacterized protein LAJ45_00990 [Morchella importuna]|uniref:uncharacterized protein n=1 Tax=Morchella importuna TaxID=1174673 RepID=UPI001E8D9EEC|nr:uncharacterized protein LAJ45_00990 [Morchella importuna]KAH8154463.1 hypothetical protein LAJ45_00990 [Morchella importuna]
MSTPPPNHNAHILSHLQLLISLHNQALDRVRGGLDMLLSLLTRYSYIDVLAEAENELTMQHGQLVLMRLHEFRNSDGEIVELREYLEEAHMDCRYLADFYEDLKRYVERCEEAVVLEKLGVRGLW